MWGIRGGEQLRGSLACWPREGGPIAGRSACEGVLDARALYPDSSLADLYDPLAMPRELVDAHHKLDRAVDRLYQRKPFESDADRVSPMSPVYTPVSTSWACRRIDRRSITRPEWRLPRSLPIL